MNNHPSTELTENKKDHDIVKKNFCIVFSLGYRNTFLIAVNLENFPGTFHC
jgi:hypothetical protein